MLGLESKIRATEEILLGLQELREEYLRLHPQTQTKKNDHINMIVTLNSYTSEKSTDTKDPLFSQCRDWSLEGFARFFQSRTNAQDVLLKDLIAEHKRLFAKNISYLDMKKFVLSFENGGEQIE